MNRRVIVLLISALILSAIPACRGSSASDQARIDALEAEVKALRQLVPEQAAGKDQARIDALEAEVKALRKLVPDQAAVMAIQAYHFTNLWSAVDQENWPLADFYLSETRKNLKWAVRVIPVRKDKNGAEVNLVGIADSLENGPFSKMKEAIDGKDKARAVKAYKDVLAGCYGCHEAASMPFLRPRVPTGPEAQIISFAPGAPLPQ